LFYCTFRIHNERKFDKNPTVQFIMSSWLNCFAFTSSKNSHFQNEAKCKTFLVIMSFICMRIKNNFHMTGFHLSSLWNLGFGQLGIYSLKHSSKLVLKDRLNDSLKISKFAKNCTKNYLELTVTGWQDFFPHKISTMLAATAMIISSFNFVFPQFTSYSLC